MNTCIRILAVTALLVLAIDDVRAHGDISCSTPKKEWRRSVDLQRELKQRGWKVRSIKEMNGCYEVYGFDENDKRVEAFFDPKSFARVD